MYLLASGDHYFKRGSKLTRDPDDATIVKDICVAERFAKLFDCEVVKFSEIEEHLDKMRRARFENQDLKD